MESLEDLRRRLVKVSERVEWLLENKPTTRGDDRILILEYFKYFEPIFRYDESSQQIYMTHPLKYEEFRKLTSFETIRRTRQKLQEKNPQLQPTAKTMLKRAFREENMKKLMIRGLDDADLVDYTEDNGEYYE